MFAISMLGTEVISLKLAIHHMVVTVKETDYFNRNFVQKPLFKLVF